MKLPLKKSGSGLFFRIIAAIILGAVLGFVMPEVGVRILKTFNVIFEDVRDIRFNNVHAKSLEHPLISWRPGNPLKRFSFTDCSFRKVSDDELPGWKRHGPALWERVQKTTFEHVEGFTYNNMRFDAP